MTPEKQLQFALRQALRREVEIRLTGTDKTPVAAKRTGGRIWTLRLHPCFRLAGEEVIHVLASHLHRPSPHSAKILREFVRAAREEVPGHPQRRPTLRPVGRHFDLREVRDRISETHFNSELRPPITWGKANGPRRRRRRSIIFGSYDDSLNLIRIHPDLDDESTPLYFLEYIVHHEMLHAIYPVEYLPSGRRVVHTAAFRRAEKQFPEHERAMAHLKKWTDSV